MRFGPILVCAALLAGACKTVDEPPRPVPWSQGQPPLADHEPIRGLSLARGIVHLHSPYSHDACDGEGLLEGAVNEPCLVDLREGLCALSMDYAFVTDHPSHMAEQEFEDLFHIRPGDEPVREDGAVIANRVDCGDGTEVLLMAGIEDALMPVGMLRHADGSPEERDILYNRDDPDAIAAFRELGGIVLSNHTEGRSRESLLAHQAAGLAGIEMFNLHAMVDPNIRPDDLGLDAFSWLDAVAPFTDSDGSARPDLMFLAFYEEQTVSIEHWDAMLEIGPTVGIAGTDAHQNVFNLPMRDGERLDSYRRMMRWFNNWLLLDEDSPHGHRRALEQGRVYVVFESLGTPVGLDVHLESGSGIIELGGTGEPGMLQVTCPALDERTPRGVEEPEISAAVLRNGAPFAEGCGPHELREPGVYRVVFSITPRHLTRFLGAEPGPYLRAYPWIYTNAIRVQ